MVTRVPERGDLWWVALDPTVGSKIRKTRPCLILSADLINEHRRTVLAVPLSSSPKPHPPITVAIHCEGREGVVIVDQLRAISKERLRYFIEKAKPEEVEEVVKAILTLIEA